MNRKRILSSFLAAALLVAAFVPATVRADENTSAIHLNKTARYNQATNDYTITLEAYATGQEVISQTRKSKPTDIVLVLDQSGSMGNCINCGAEYHRGSWPSDNPVCSYEAVGTASAVQKSDTTKYYYKLNRNYYEAIYCDENHYNSPDPGWYEQSTNGYYPHGDRLSDSETLYKGIAHEHRLDALKDALDGFYASVSQKANTEENHRIAVVGFSSSGYKNTELLTGVTLQNGDRVTGGQYYYYPTTSNINGKETPSQTDYRNALQDMSTAAGKTNVQNAINALTASGGTEANAGLSMAENIFRYNTVANDADGIPTRNRVVILFTDGDTDNKNSAIQSAYRLKNDYNATVYSVGVFDGANGTPVTGNSWGSTSNTNKFMHVVSSNFKNTSSWDNGNVSLSQNTYPKDGSSYYLSADNTATLSSIFEQIVGKIDTETTVTTLDANTVIKDVIAQQFTMPENTSDIKVYTQESNGSTSAWKNRAAFTDAQVVLDSESRTVSATNFSFRDNWCGQQNNQGTTSFHNGKKLIIEFNVKAEDGFLGGNDVYTNTSAGVYENANATEPVLTFPRPQVNVPIQDVTVTAGNRNVYLLGDLTAGQIRAGATARCGDVYINLAEENYGLEPWQYEYVTITTTYTDPSGNTVADLSDLRDDTTYTVSVTIAPKTQEPTSTEGTKAETKTNSATGNIHVFTPTLTFRDSEVYYGDTAPTDFSGNKTAEVWKHDGTLDTAVTMTGDKPELSLHYTPGNGISGNQVNTKNDIPVDVTVNIGTTDVTGSTAFVHQACTDRTDNLPQGKKFLLHVNTCSLTVKKQAATGTTIGSDEYFVFNIRKDGAAYTQVTIQGTGSVTISQLPVGAYTVEEDDDTAWRYDSSMSNGAVELSKDRTSATVTCTNGNKDNKWLNHFARVINTFGDKN